MCDAHIVQVVDGGGGLSDYGGGFPFGEAFFLGVLVECPSVHVLKDDVEMLIVVEESVHL